MLVTYVYARYFVLWISCTCYAYPKVVGRAIMTYWWSFKNT